MSALLFIAALDVEKNDKDDIRVISMKNSFIELDA